ncbi:unnamed protein product [Closterium sp. NIES-53]
MAPFMTKLSLLWRPSRTNAWSTAKSPRSTDKSFPAEPRVAHSSTSPASILHTRLTADPPEAASIEASDTQASHATEQCPDSCCIVPATPRESLNEPAHGISSSVVRGENGYSMARLADGLFGSCSVTRRGHTISFGSNGALSLDVEQSLHDNDDFLSRPADIDEAEPCNNLDNDRDLESPYPTAIIHRSSTGGSSSVDTVTCAAVTPAIPSNKPANGGRAGDSAPLSPSLGNGSLSPPPVTAFISSTPSGGSASARTPRLRVSFAPLRVDDQSADRHAEVAAEAESGKGGRRRNAAAGPEEGETASVSGAVAGEGGRSWESQGCGERAGGRRDLLGELAGWAGKGAGDRATHESNDECAEATGSGFESQGTEADGRAEGGPRGTTEQPPGPQAKSAQPGSSRQGNKGAPRAVVGERRKGRRFEHMVVTIPDREEYPAFSGARSATGGKRTAEGRMDGESGGMAGKERGTRDGPASVRGNGGGGRGGRGGGGERAPSEVPGSFSFNAGDDRGEPCLERNITWTAGGGSSRGVRKGGKSGQGESSFAQRAAVTRREEWGAEGRRGQDSGAEWQVGEERSRSGRMVSDPQLNKAKTLSGPLTVSRRAMTAIAPRGAGEGRSRAAPVAPTPRSAKGVPTPRARQEVSPPWALNSPHASRSFTDRPGPCPARACSSPRSRSFKELPGRGAPPAIPPSPRAIPPPKAGGPGASSNALSPRSPPAWSSASSAPAARDASLAAATPRSARAGGGAGAAGNGGGSAGSRKQQRGAEERERRRDEKEEQKMAQAMRIMEKLRSEAKGGEGEKEGEEGREGFEAEEEEGEEWEVRSVSSMRSRGGAGQRDMQRQALPQQLQAPQALQQQQQQQTGVVMQALQQLQQGEQQAMLLQKSPMLQFPAQLMQQQTLQLSSHALQQLQLQQQTLSQLQAHIQQQMQLNAQVQAQAQAQVQAQMQAQALTPGQAPPVMLSSALSLPCPVLPPFSATPLDQPYQLQPAPPVAVTATTAVGMGEYATAGPAVAGARVAAAGMGHSTPSSMNDPHAPQPFHSRPPAFASTITIPPHFPLPPQQQIQPSPRWQQPQAMQQARGSGCGRVADRDGGGLREAATYSGPAREQRPLRRAQSYETGYRAVTDGVGQRGVGRGDGGIVRGGGGGGGGAVALVSPNSDGVMYDRVQGRALGYAPEQVGFPLPHGSVNRKMERGGMGWGIMQMQGQGLGGAAGRRCSMSEQQGAERGSWGYGPFGEEGGPQGAEEEEGSEWEVTEFGGGRVGSGGRNGRGEAMHGGSGGMYEGQDGHGQRTGSNRNRSGSDWCYMAQAPVQAPVQAGSGEQRRDGEETGEYVQEEQEGSGLYSDGDGGSADLYCEAKERWRGEDENGSGEWYVEDDDVAVARAVTVPVDGQGQQRWAGGGDGAWQGRRRGSYGEEDEE